MYFWWCVCRMLSDLLRPSVLANVLRWLARARREIIDTFYANEIANDITLPLRKVSRYVKGMRLLRIVNPTVPQNP